MAGIDNLTPFKPGQSGNPGGRPKTRPYKDALLRLLKAAGDDTEKLDKLALALYSKALEGDVPAQREIADRIDGKVAQPLANAEDETFKVALEVIERVIVKPKEPSES